MLAMVIVPQLYMGFVEIMFYEVLWCYPLSNDNGAGIGIV